MLNLSIFILRGECQVEPMHVVTTSSNLFAKQTGVMMQSLLENLSLYKNICIYVLYGRLSNENQWKLQRIADQFNHNIKFILMDDSLYEGCRKGRRLRLEAYYRLSIPDVISEKINKVLYLDSDIIVQEDISSLWDTSLGDFFAAAVQDPGAEKFQRYKVLSIPHSNGYFNSGVMLINLEQWRAGEISKKVLEFIKGNPRKVLLLDQDGLNVILQGKWLNLDPKWNYQTAHFGKLFTKPAIIHYTTAKKPWKHQHPLSAPYLKYSSKVIWSDHD